MNTTTPDPAAAELDHPEAGLDTTSPDNTGTGSPAWTGEHLLACVDGPMAGHWYTAGDWHERLVSAHHMAARHQRPSPATTYRPTGQQVAHPHLPGITGTALTYPTTSTSVAGQLDHQDDAGHPDACAPVSGLDAQAAAGGGFRVLVTGSRTWTSYRQVADALDDVLTGLPAGTALTLVHGACPTGADALAGLWARRHHDDGVIVERHPGDWATHHNAAGPIRNQQMIDAGADLCLAFIQDHSPGATHCATNAQTAHIPTLQHTHTTRADVAERQDDDESGWQL